MRMRQGAPGVTCSPPINPSLSHRSSVEAATAQLLGRSVHREQLGPPQAGPGHDSRGFFQEWRRLATPTGGEAFHREPFSCLGD